jgi:hypothetical protein
MQAVHRTMRARSSQGNSHALFYVRYMLCYAMQRGYRRFALWISSSVIFERSHRLQNTPRCANRLSGEANSCGAHKVSGRLVRPRERRRTATVPASSTRMRSYARIVRRRSGSEGPLLYGTPSAGRNARSRAMHSSVRSANSVWIVSWILLSVARSTDALCRPPSASLPPRHAQAYSRRLVEDDDFRVLDERARDRQQ